MSRYMFARWPFYAWVIGGGFLIVGICLALALLFQINLLLPLSLLVVVMIGYLTFTSLWAAFLTYDQSIKKTVRYLIREGQILPTDTVVYPYIAEDGYISQLRSHLSLGQIWVIDVYSPQIMPGREVRRLRQQRPVLEPDRRLVQMPGRIDLIPMQVNSADVIVLAHVLSAIEQAGDRDLLLDEVTRLLKPGGRIVLVEPHRSWLSRIASFSPYRYMITETEMMALLKRNRFVQRNRLQMNGFLMLMKGVKPSQYQSIQLPLDI